MARPKTDLDWAMFLARQHDAILPALRAKDLYYEGLQPLRYMQEEIARLVGDRIAQVVINWPQLVVDSIEERLDVRGFRLPDEHSSDKEMWRVWQANKMDQESPLGRVDALTMGRSFMTVGTNERDKQTPLVTVESPLEMFAYVDIRTREVAAALRRTINHGDIARDTERQATLYLPNATIWYDWTNGWLEVDRDDHMLGRVPVVPMVHRARTNDRYGKSALNAIIPLSDAACKIATDMMVAAEAHAIPLRAIFGIGPESFVDANGNPMTAMQAIMGKLLTIPTENAGDVLPHEFSASNLENFHKTLMTLAGLVASLAGIDPNQLGVRTDSPASAEAILAREARLIKRCERVSTSFEGSYEDVQYIVKRFQTGEWDPRLLELETMWRNPATPTRAQEADAAVKKYAAGIISRRQAQEDCGYTSAQIRRMAKEIAEDQDELLGIKRPPEPHPEPAPVKPELVGAAA